MSKPSDLDQVEQKIVEAIRADSTGFIKLREVKQIIGEATADPRAPRPINRPANAYNRTVILKLCGIIEKLTDS